MAPFQKIIQRLYLHQNLVEEASIVLGQADLTQESYEDTWKRIQETYDNKANDRYCQSVFQSVLFQRREGFKLVI